MKTYGYNIISMVQISPKFDEISLKCLILYATANTSCGVIKAKFPKYKCPIYCCTWAVDHFLTACKSNNIVKRIKYVMVS